MQPDARPAEDVRALPAVELGRRAQWWQRRGSKRSGFRYVDSLGRAVTGESDIERIKALVIPPAWRHVRICPSSRGALQAIGVDTAGRVQYKYHAAHAARRQRKKYEKVERFGEHLPALRRATNQDLERDGLVRERVLAAMIRLINDLYFRVGSEHSVRRYRTYGVTTLRRRHLTIGRGGKLSFDFVGKHGKRHRRILVDEDLAALMRELKSLPGARLFQYLDSEGKRISLKPRDVNDYIKAATAPMFSSKDFRTWGGTLLAACHLAEIGAAENQAQAARNVVHAVKRVAEHLGNTPTVCRACYIHPIVIEQYLAGVTLEEFRPRFERRILRTVPEYDPEELALLRLFERARERKAA